LQIAAVCQRACAAFSTFLNVLLKTLLETFLFYTERSSIITSTINGTNLCSCNLITEAGFLIGLNTDRRRRWASNDRV